MSVWEDILAQVDNYRRVIEHHTRYGAAVFKSAARLAEKFDEVVFTGVGSGLNATIPAYYYLMQQGKPAQYIDTTELIYGLMPGIKDKLLVLNTRSGETAELIRAAELARRAGIATIAVTNEPKSSVAKLADVCIPTYSRWDQLVVISAYGGMLATELLLSSVFIGKFDEMLEQLQCIPTIVEQVLQETIAKREELCEFIGEYRPIYMLGRGASLASAFGGALVIEETSRRPVVPMASGLFRQGPIEVADLNFRAIVFEGTCETKHLSRRLAEDLIAKGCGIVWVGNRPIRDAFNINIPDLTGYLLPTVEIIPSQVLAHDLAVRAGITPGSVRYIEKVITSEEGIQKRNNK